MAFWNSDRLRIMANDAFVCDKRTLAMATEILMKDLRQAFAQARTRRFDGRAARCIRSYATRKLHPSAAANSLPRRFAMNSAAARSRSIEAIMELSRRSAVLKSYTSVRSMGLGLDGSDIRAL